MTLPLLLSLLLFQPAPKELAFPLPTHSVTLKHENMPLSQVLAVLRKETGITVIDDRALPDVSLRLDLNKVSFWQALDAVALQAKARVLISAKGDLVRLIRAGAGDQAPPTSYSGDFRVRAMRISSIKDFDTENSQCLLNLDVSWTPTLRPLFLDTQVQDLQVIDTKGQVIKVPGFGSSLASVDGRTNLALDLLLPGFPRTDKEIGLLQGRINAVVPSKFLSFRFDTSLDQLRTAPLGGAQRRLVQEDVVCRIDRIVLGEDRWTVTVGLEYPPGNRQLESFQAGSLIVHNEITLVSKDGKRRLTSTGNVVDLVSSRRAEVRYHFTDRPGQQRGAAANWTVRYLAPAKIIDVPVRFTFRKVPLP